MPKAFQADPTPISKYHFTVGKSPDFTPGSLTYLAPKKLFVVFMVYCDAMLAVLSTKAIIVATVICVFFGKNPMCD